MATRLPAVRGISAWRCVVGKLSQFKPSSRKVWDKEVRKVVMMREERLLLVKVYVETAVSLIEFQEESGQVRERCASPQVELVHDWNMPEVRIS